MIRASIECDTTRRLWVLHSSAATRVGHAPPSLRTLSRRLVTLLGVVGAVACAPAPSEPSGFIVEEFVGVHVRGHIITGSGAPVTDATLALWMRARDTCSDGFQHGAASSDSTGHFSRTVSMRNSPVDFCLWIVIVPPAGSASRADTVRVPRVRLDDPFRTLDLTIVLPPPTAS
jgi:hypothetical protein